MSHSQPYVAQNTLLDSASLSASGAAKKRLRLESAAVGVLALILFLTGGWHRDVIGFDSRFVVFAQEMLRHGVGFFPTTYGEPYADYSGFSTFLIYLFSRPLGQVTSLTAWLPTAIASAMTVTLMYRLLSPYSRLWAWMSSALLLLTNTFISETRAVSLDQMLATVTFAVFYLGYAADHFASSRRMGWVLALLVLGFAIRGPLGLVVPTGVLCSYYLVSGQWRRLMVFGASALMLLVVCIVTLLALARGSGGSGFAAEVVRMQFTSRMDGSEGSKDFFWYFTNSMSGFALAYPLAIVVLAGLLGTRVVAGRLPTTKPLELVYLCVAAALTVIVGLSIPQAKKARYLLPMLPMVAIISAYPFQVTGQRWASAVRILTLAVCAVFPALLMLTLLWARTRLPEQLGNIGPMLVLLGLLQMAALAGLLRKRLRAQGLALCAVVAVWSFYTGMVEPFERGQYDTRSFTLAAWNIMQQSPAPLVLHGMGKDAKAIKFIVNLDKDIYPQFTQTAQQLVGIRGPAYVVMSHRDYSALPDLLKAPMQVRYSGLFDKEDYVLVSLQGAMSAGY